MDEYSLNLKGYYLQDMMGAVPSSPGIYVVYRGHHDLENDFAILKELIYIGESDNLNLCLNEQKNYRRCLELLQEEEKLFFCFAITEVEEQIRKKITNILVECSLPILNDFGTNNDSHDIAINIEGDSHAFLPSKLNPQSQYVCL